MLKIAREFVEQVHAAESPGDLHESVQNAITLELATIPPYFAAYCTLKIGTNRTIARILKDIFIDEMLHMTLMGNLKIALGGKPSIVEAGAALTYPRKLPMNVGNSVMVHLRKCCVTQIEEVFMEIEKPEKPIEFSRLAAVDYATIGEFYRALVAKLEELGDGAFDKDFSKQVLTDRFFPYTMVPITNVETARTAILDVIVRQGEGTEISPEDEQGNLAHYYRFKQIVVGKELVQDSNTKKWSYTGPKLEIDLPNVLNMDEDPRADKYTAGSEARIKADAFNADYSTLLRDLDRAFNGSPTIIGGVIDAMGDLTTSARATLDVASSTTTQTGLSFEYVS